MNLLSIDLELNNLKNGQTPKIIQIGAAILDTETGNILDKISLIVNPFEKLSDFIINLTGITQEQVDSGLVLPIAYKKLKDFHAKWECFPNPIVWGGGDCEALRKELNLDEQNFLFGRRFFDAKTLYQSYRIANNLSPRSGLAKSLTKVGLQFQGRKHDAMDDAINTALIYHKLLSFYKKRTSNE